MNGCDAAVNFNRCQCCVANSCCRSAIIVTSNHQSWCHRDEVGLEVAGAVDGLVSPCLQCLLSDAQQHL